MAPILAQAIDRFGSRLHAHQPAEAERITARIIEIVGDPSLHRGTCLAIAWCVVEGTYPRIKLEGILDRAEVRDRQRPPAERGKYFLGAVKQSMTRDHGLPWPPVGRAPTKKTDDEERAPY